MLKGCAEPSMLTGVGSSQIFRILKYCNQLLLSLHYAYCTIMMLISVLVVIMTLLSKHFDYYSQAGKM